MSPTLADRHDELKRLTTTDPDPRVRRRAHALLLVAEGIAVVQVARLFQTAAHRVRAWRSRFLAEGRRGLADQARTGRPPKLGPDAVALLGEALEHSPQDYGFVVTVWSVRELRQLVGERLGVWACPATVHRVIQQLGYRYRRPRHDLHHRQDPEAVKAAGDVLDWLKKRAPTAAAGFTWSTSTNVRSTVIPGWQRSGSGGAGTAA
jgi:transposase